MKNTLLVLCLGVVLIGCDGMKEAKIGHLSGAETKTLSEYSSSIESGLLAIDGQVLFESGSSKLSKSASDYLIHCTYTPRYDARGRKNGRTIKADGSCPIDAVWEELIQSATAEEIIVEYVSRLDSFTDHIPLSGFSVKGLRESRLEGGEILSTTTYRGSSIGQFGDKSTFTATRHEFALTTGLAVKKLGFSYEITVLTGDLKFSGRINAAGTHFVNGIKITPEEFQTLFFVLK